MWGFGALLVVVLLIPPIAPAGLVQSQRAEIEALQNENGKLQDAVKRADAEAAEKMVGPPMSLFYCCCVVLFVPS